MLLKRHLPIDWFDQYTVDGGMDAVTGLTVDAFLTDDDLPPIPSFDLIRVVEGLELATTTDIQAVERIVSLIDSSTLLYSPFEYVDTHVATALARKGYVSLDALTPVNQSATHEGRRSVLAAFGRDVSQPQYNELNRLVASLTGGRIGSKPVAYYLNLFDLLDLEEVLVAERLPDCVSLAAMKGTQVLGADELMNKAVETLDESLQDFASDVLFESDAVPFGALKVFAQKMAEVPDPYLVLDILAQFKLYYGLLPNEVAVFEGLTGGDFATLYQATPLPRPPSLAHAVAALNN